MTEAVTGLDLVAEQIAIAEGRGLRLSQANVGVGGHAIECRVNAEDPAEGFRPSPGTVTGAVFPAGPGIRVDTHVQAGSAVPPQYDSLLAKLVVTGADRDQALARMRGALARCRIEGVATTLAMLSRWSTMGSSSRAGSTRGTWGGGWSGRGGAGMERGGGEAGMERGGDGAGMERGGDGGTAAKKAGGGG